MKLVLKSSPLEMPLDPAVSAVCRRLAVLYESFGSSDYIGEAISITEHSIQAAHFAAKHSHEDTELIIASLLHDVGHVLGLEAGLELGMNGCGIPDHEHVGADFLAKLCFPSRVCKLVRSHVQAKRYLCAKKPEYYTQLSDASKTTLSFQGGPMTEKELTAFESDPDHQNCLNMRTFDENAKLTEFTCPLSSLESYFPLIDALIGEEAAKNNLLSSGVYVLSAPQLTQYLTNGFVKLSNLLAYDTISIADVDQWSSDVIEWPKVEGKWMSHFELTEDGRKVPCRTENFVDYHDGMASLARGNVLHVTSQLFGEQSVLFKEKVNYRPPGGAGFAAHQDSTAYIGLGTDHITAMVAIDSASAENGCLQVARGVWVQGQVPLIASGAIVPEVEATMTFERVECSAGDVLFFNGYLPHRSDANLSSRSRRALFLTYNPLSQGDFHEQYYQAKHAQVNGFDGSHAISFQTVFQGKIVD